LSGQKFPPITEWTVTVSPAIALTKETYGGMLTATSGVPATLGAILAQLTKMPKASKRKREIKRFIILNPFLDPL